MTMIAGIALMAYPVYCIGNNKKIHMIMAEATSAFFMLYIILTAILYSLNKYTLLTVEILTVICALIICGVSVVCFRKKIQIEKIKWSKEIIATIGVIIVCAGLSVSNYESFGMGQDEGVYQNEAINILYGKPEWKQSLKEWSTEIAGRDPNYNIYADWYLLGFDPYKNNYEPMDEIDPYPFIDIDIAREDSFAGYFHGIPTYPSFLALCTQIFGISHMAWGNVLLLICTLLFANEILFFFKADWKLRNLCLLLIGLSPEVVWVNMSTLTEAGITLILTSFFYYFLVCEKEKKQIMSVIAVITFSVYHVTIYTMMPLFILFFWGFYIARNQIKYIIYSLTVLVVFWFGYLFMLKMNARYVIKNYGPATKYIEDYIAPTIFVLAVTITGIILSIIVAVVWKLVNKKILDRVKNLKNKELLFKRMVVVALSALLLLDLVSTINAIAKANGRMPTLMVYAVLSGIVVIPALIVVILSGKYKLSIYSLAMITAFSWCILFYSAIMQPAIKYYYYYSRYLAPFIPLIAIMFGIVFVDYKKLSLILLTAALMFFVPFQYFIHTNKDDSRMEWKVIEDVMEIAKEDFDENTDVFMDPNMFYYLYFPIRACSDANIYFVDMQYIHEMMETDPDRKIYYIAENDYSEYDDTIYFAEVIGIEDTLERRVPILNLPTTFDENKYNVSVVYLTDLLKETKDYRIEESDVCIEEVSCEEDGDVIIKASGILPEDGLYLNDGLSYISYHLMAAADNEMLVFDNARYPIGMLVENEVEIKFNLENYYLDVENQAEETQDEEIQNDEELQNENRFEIDDLIIQIDMVREGDKWLSFEGRQLPQIRFVRSEAGWSMQ